VARAARCGGRVPPHKIRNGTEQIRGSIVLLGWGARMPSKNERVELEMKIMKARQLARAADDSTRERLVALIAELERKPREIDE
jgi:hypothetical protein